MPINPVRGSGQYQSFYEHVPLKVTGNVPTSTF